MKKFFENILDFITTWVVIFVSVLFCLCSLIITAYIDTTFLWLLIDFFIWLPLVLVMLKIIYYFYDKLRKHHIRKKRKIKKPIYETNNY
jgi:amino acid transporter